MNKSGCAWLSSAPIWPAGSVIGNGRWSGAAVECRAIKAVAWLKCAAVAFTMTAGPADDEDALASGHVICA
jgi:hypothetical protein